MHGPKLSRKMLSVLIAFCLIISLLPFSQASAAAPEEWDGSVATEFAAGTGTEINPYLITTGAELAYFAELTNGGAIFAASYFKLGNDIVLNSPSKFRFDSNGKLLDIKGNVALNEWTPIGAFVESINMLRQCHFVEFDGDGYTITGLYIDSELDNIGLFGHASGLIKDLNIDVSYIRGKNLVGTVAGDKKGASKNVHVENGVVIGQGFVGGLFGGHYNDGIDNCHNAADVRLEYGEEDYEYPERHVGGITGDIDSYFIKNSSNTGEIKVNSGIKGRSEINIYAAGITPTMSETVIQNCFNTGNISGGFNSGGILGLGTGNILSCFNTGSIKQLANLAPKHAGGIAGGLEGRNFFIDNCYNTGEVNANFAGGIVGKNYSITLSNSYTTVTPFSSEGPTHSAVSGTTTTYSYERNCYFIAYPLLNFYETISEQSEVRLKTSGDMQSLAFVDLLNKGNASWAFDNYSRNNGYPVLANVNYEPKPTEPPEPIDPGPVDPPPVEPVVFSDVHEGQWFYEAVSYVGGLGIMKGTSEEKFSPNKKMTREMFVTVLGRMAEIEGLSTDGFTSSFSDVTDGTEYYKYISWATSNGIVDGMGDNKFGMRKTVTREQAATLIMRYVDFMKYTLPALTDGDLNKFADQKNIAAYARPAMSRAVESKLIEGYTTTTPTGTILSIKARTGIKRSEAAQVIYRLLETIE